MVWCLLYPWRTYAASTPIPEWQMRQLVLLNFSFTRQYKHMSKSRGLRFSRTRSVLLKSPSTHLTPPVPDFGLCRRAGSQPIHTTSTFELLLRLPVNSLSIVPPVLRNVMMLPLSHSWPTDMIDLQQSSILGRNLKVTRQDDTASCAQATCRCLSW